MVFLLQKQLSIFWPATLPIYIAQYLAAWPLFCHVICQSHPVFRQLRYCFYELHKGRCRPPVVEHFPLNLRLGHFPCIVSRENPANAASRCFPPNAHLGSQIERWRTSGQPMTRLSGDGAASFSVRLKLICYLWSVPCDQSRLISPPGNYSFYIPAYTYRRGFLTM